MMRADAGFHSDEARRHLGQPGMVKSPRAEESRTILD
jgi:hypothetical protein